MLKIIEVQSASELAQIKDLFREYYRFLAHEHGLDISYQGLEDELAALPGKFAPPAGRLIMAVTPEQSIGCAALRPIDERVCELKRMYVQPQFRGQGIGRALSEELIHAARRIGYERMRLDTANFLGAAIRLYESFGFQRIEPYNAVPEDIRAIALFMELALD